MNSAWFYPRNVDRMNLMFYGYSSLKFLRKMNVLQGTKEKSNQTLQKWKKENERNIKISKTNYDTKYTFYPALRNHESHYSKKIVTGVGYIIN